ncbi:hypothetical protein N0V85_002395 [Neurospora sp. IMI 360204]|nr:hypothetical protein N0V85_002395 [Neurospora sp. IMI 360204]
MDVFQYDIALNPPAPSFTTRSVHRELLCRSGSGSGSGSGFGSRPQPKADLLGRKPATSTPPSDDEDDDDYDEDEGDDEPVDVLEES